MKSEKSEVLKLDHIDRKVLFWLMNNRSENVLGWIEYIAADYKQRREADIDPDKLYNEAVGEGGEPQP